VFKEEIVPRVEYPLPITPELTGKLENRIWLGAMIDAEGAIAETDVVTDKIDKYKYAYRVPELTFTTTSKKLLEKVWELTHWQSYHEEIRPARKITYHLSTRRRYAIATMIQILPYLVEKREKALEILKKYKKKPYIRIR